MRAVRIRRMRLADQTATVTRCVSDSTPSSTDFRVRLMNTPGDAQSDRSSGLGRRADDELASQQLRHARDLLEAVTWGTRVLIATVDREFRYTYFNQEHHRELKRLTGKDTAIGMSLLDALAEMPDERAQALAVWSRALNGETVVQTLPFGDPGRYRRWYTTRHTPIRDAAGAVVGAGEVTSDVTELVQAQQALRESESRLQAAEVVAGERQRFLAVLEALPPMICLLTPDYRVAFANRAFREKFGESHGRRCYEYCFGRSEPCEFCESYDVLKTGQPHHWEVAGPDGSQIDVYDFPFTDVDGTPLILEMDVDITERRKAEAELARHREHLEELVKERTAELEAANVRLRAGNEELARFNRAMIGRELRMIELKKEVNELCVQAGLPPRYRLDFEKERP